MGIVPDDKPGKLNFFNARIAAWTTNAVAMGSTAPTIADVSTKLDAANDKYAAQVAAASGNQRGRESFKRLPTPLIPRLGYHRCPYCNRVREGISKCCSCSKVQALRRQADEAAKRLVA